MNLTITPAPLSGAVTPPPGKSQLHRFILAAALAPGDSVIENAAPSDDILATLRCIEALGASYTSEGTVLRIHGGGTHAVANSLPVFDCGESGSTLRFLIPVALATAGGGIFKGHGRLMRRPLDPYFEIFREKGITLSQEGNTLTLCGKLTPGEYRLSGGVSSQFFSGLLLALPLLDGPSTLIPTSFMESASYISITTDAMQRFGVTATSHCSPLHWRIDGAQRYAPRTVTVESDWSQAAFWYAVKELGSAVTVNGMSEESLQGDHIFPYWMERLRRGGDLTLSAAQNPDLAAPLAARAALMDGSLRITDINRLRLKESDRVAAINTTLSAIGADIAVDGNSLFIRGRKTLHGGVSVGTFDDHRIAMMLAVAATRCEKPITLLGAQCIRKSYPNFWEDYKMLGGIIHEHTGK